MPRLPSPRTRPALVPFGTAVLVSAILGACADAGTSGPEVPGPGQAATIPAADDISPARLAPLAGLQACPTPPARPDGMVPVTAPLPEGAVPLQASTTGTLQSVQGWIPLTPVETLVAYLRLDGWEVLTAEDEVFESEILLTNGVRRVFVKAQAVCDRGSAFVLFDSEDPALVPTPSGGGAP